MRIKISDIDTVASYNISRQEVFPDDCQDLAASMARHGQKVPVGVRRLPANKWKLIYGFRRYTSACILGWDELEAIEVVDDESGDGLTNFLENLAREDLTFWQECVAIQSLFPEDMSHADVGLECSKSRTWARTRRRVWELSEADQLRVRLGELSPSDVSALLAHSPEEREGVSALMAQAKADGESTRDRIAATRKHPRSIKQLRRVQTLLHDSGREDWKAIVLYALGEIDEETLLTQLDNWR